jgi:hypothetical protein
MAQKVRYEGTTGGKKSRDVLYVDGVRLNKGADVEVEDDLAKELLSGDSERLKGYKIVAAEEQSADAAEGGDSAEGQSDGETPATPRRSR